MLLSITNKTISPDYYWGHKQAKISEYKLKTPSFSTTLTIYAASYKT